jgi:hypothetical protein
MSESVRISLLDPSVEADQDTAADLLCGLTATLEVESDAETWRDEHFPVLELALALRRHVDPQLPFRFSSMCMEEDPVLVVSSEASQTAVEMYDGTRVQAPDHEVRVALAKFVEAVDRVLRELCGRTIADLEASLH